MGLIAEVQLEQNLGEPLDYAVPREMEGDAAIGRLVEVPLRKKNVKGMIIGFKERSPYPVRPIARLLSETLSEPLWQLAQWMARYYCCSLSRVLRCFIPPNVRKETKAKEELFEEDFFPTQPKVLNEEQRLSLERVRGSFGSFATHLLYGVTGSGKTEVYLQAIQETLNMGKGALLLVPEIALTAQTIERFRARFGVKLAILHHRRSLGERTAAWEGLKSGELRIAIGARSAIFSPIQNLGLIIIDEEHESSYKQGEEPAYHARDVAVMRGKLEQAVVILGSATPSLESFYNAETGKYQLHTLKQRATSAALPKMTVVDLKKTFEKNGGFTHFSEELIDAMRQRYERGEQTLLLLNRRGFYRMQVCGSCRHVVKCPHCDLSLIYHRDRNEISCPLCDLRSPPERSCPACSAALDFRGFGTEHVERSLHALFPEIRTLRMDRDTTRGKESHEELFKKFKSHKADVLIGTQMIAKGLHFPSVTLVGILNADTSLHLPDLRAAETTFQLIVQIAGRAGRADLPGDVILQTFTPDHPLLRMAAAQDYTTFYQQEKEERKLFQFPPFCRLVKVVFKGSDRQETEQAIAQFHQALRERAAADTQFLAPTPAGHPKIKDLYRFQFVMKTKAIQALSAQIASLRSTVPKKISLLVDIDPITTFF